MLDLNLIKTEIKRPITRYMIILYLITLFSQLIYFRENNILPSTAKYDFFLILNHLKEISIAIMAYFFSVIIFHIFRSFTYYTKIIPYFYWGDFIGIIAYLCFFYYLGTYYPINDYLKNWDIIFLCIFLNLMIETSQYISKIDKYKDLINQEIQCFIHRVIICSIIIAIGLIYIKNNLLITNKI